MGRSSGASACAVVHSSSAWLGVALVVPDVAELLVEERVVGAGGEQRREQRPGPGRPAGLQLPLRLEDRLADLVGPLGCRDRGGATHRLALGLDQGPDAGLLLLDQAGATGLHGRQTARPGRQHQQQAEADGEARVAAQPRLDPARQRVAWGGAGRSSG